MSHINDLSNGLVDLITFCISGGDSFLPDPGSYDDLFYKIVEAGPVLTRFREVYNQQSSSGADKTGTSTDENNTQSIDTLIDVSKHFQSLLFYPDKTKASNSADPSQPAPQVTRKKNLSPREVHEIIKKGYDTLSIRSHEGLGNWEKWRESDRKSQLKRITRLAVEDARTVVVKPGVVHFIGGSIAGSAQQI